MPTPLNPVFRKRIDDAIDVLVRKQVAPWSFLTAGPPFRVLKFDGTPITYLNVGFSGSPETVFWSRYIEPFLEHLAITEIEAAVQLATQREVDAREVLPEVSGLLKSGTRKLFAHMADVDRRLRGKGYPDKVPLRSAEREISAMDRFIDERIDAELRMWKPKPWLESWYANNKALVWLIGIGVAVIGACAKLL